MPAYGYAILIGSWALWILPFARLKANKAKPVQMDRRARWGVILQTIGYMLVWADPWVLRDPGTLRFALSIPFFFIGCFLSWNSVQSLGKQWRIEAGLNDDHELVRSGAYRWMRHPIYASMLAMFLGSGLVVALWARFAIGLVIFLIGMEVRVRVEDGLLTARFGREFEVYRESVAAYVPGIR